MTYGPYENSSQDEHADPEIPHPSLRTTEASPRENAPQCDAAQTAEEALDAYLQNSDKDAANNSPTNQRVPPSPHLNHSPPTRPPWLRHRQRATSNPTKIDSESYEYKPRIQMYFFYILDIF